MYGCSSALPKFHTHPVSMAVDEGGVARFQCEINGVPEANIVWERNGVPLSSTDNRYCIVTRFHTPQYCFLCNLKSDLFSDLSSSRYVLLPKGILQVTAVRQGDAGIFRCVATNVANTRYSHEAMLNITGR